MGLSQVNLVYVIWKQTDFALDLWFESVIWKLDLWLKIWFVIWKLISVYLQFLKYNMKGDRSMNKINYKRLLTNFYQFLSLTKPLQH